jgi:cytochrome c oxidase cbb3-type subunit III
MRPRISLVAGAVLVLACIVARLAAQAPAAPAQPPAPVAGPVGAGGAPPNAPPAQGGRRGGGAGNPTATFPAQQRALGDPQVIARGQALYGVSCRLCHGADLRGGENGGVNLLRSQLVLRDVAGELIKPVVQEGRPAVGGSAGMPAQPLSDDDVKAVAAYLHSIIATAAGQGGPPPGPPLELDILVGDAKAGQAYFAAKCSACHSATGDLAGIAARITEPKALQNAWVGGTSGRAGGRGGRGGRGAGAAAAAAPAAPATPDRRTVTVTVTLPSGEKVQGRLDRIDDFLVYLTQTDGTQRSFARRGDVPKVEVNDPMAGHRQLLTVYTDKDMHDVTAYLVTLK